jgi:hypothetical protein
MIEICHDTPSLVGITKCIIMLFVEKIEWELLSRSVFVIDAVDACKYILKKKS